MASVSNDFGAAPLLFKHEQRLVETGVEGEDLPPEIVQLQVLATEAEHGHPGHVGVIGVGSQQLTQHRRILARAAAAALVGQEFDAIHVGKYPLSGKVALFEPQGGGSDFVGCFAGLVEPHQLAGKVLVLPGFGVAQFLFQRLADDVQVAVFAEHGGNEQPVVGRAHPPVGTVEAPEGTVFPLRHVGRHPRVGPGFGGVGGGGVAEVARGNQTAPGNWLGGPAHQHAVHPQALARREAADGELVLGRDGFDHPERFSFVNQRFSGR